MKLKRMTAALLLLAMLLSCLPLSVLAADAEPVEAEETVDTVPAETADEEVTTEEPVEEAAISTQAVNASGYFYFSAETANKLLIAPTRIAFTDGQTIRQALYASQYSFAESNSSGFITTIEGVNGNYTYGSTPEGVALDSAANTVTHFRFSEATNSTPSSGLQTLMQVMADYLTEEADVQNAAAKEYQAALSGYLSVTSENAQSYADAITAKINAYKNGQNTKYTVTFSGYSGSSFTVSAANDYGKQFTDRNHTGTLQLPAGGYTFYVRQDNRMVSGKITVSGAMTVNASLPTGDWFNEGTLKISSGYADDFDANCYKYTLQNHTATVQVPDSFTGRLYPYFELSTTGTGAKIKAVYTDVSGAVREKDIPAESNAISIDNALSRGAAGNTVILRASKADSDNYTQSMDLTLQLDRMPTLGSLRVTNAAGTAQAATESFSSTKTEYTYKILDSEQKLKIYPTATVSGSSITVNGNELAADGSATVTISGETTVMIAVSSGNYTTTYTLTIQPGQGKKVTFKTASDVTLTVVNKNGEELAYTKTVGTGGTINYLYTLVPGDDYSYVATQGTYYHAKKSFTLGSSEVIEVSVVQGDWLTSLALGNSENTGSKGNLFPEASFSKSTHTYTVNVPDYSSAVYAWVTVARGSCNAVYPRQSSASGGSATVSVVIPSKLTGTNLMQALLTGSAYSNVLTFRVSYLDKSVDVTYYTDYMICLERTLSLKNMSVSVQGGQVLMNRSGGTGFSRTETDYSVLVPAAASSLKITVQTHTDSPRYGDTDNGYLVSVNGKNVGIVENAGAVEVPLNGTETDEEIKIVVTNIYNQNAHTEYRLTIKKAATTAVAFQTNPKNALIYIYEQGAGNRVWPTDDGIFALSEGFTYYCSISLYGYAAQAGALQIVNESGQTVLRFGEEEYTDPSAVPITLQKADANPNIVDFNAEWANFRGTDSNNGVTSAKTPISAADGMLYWAVKLGDGYSSDAVSSPILVDNCLIVYAGEHIYRVNKATGVVEATGQMAGKSSFAINGPTYYDGILLVGLSNGRIQAFSAKTLESLWLYTDPLGGQPNCPITILNGYAYTGFWNGEDKDGSFVSV